MSILKEENYEQLASRAEVLERDKYGDKVLRLDNGLFLKQFRIRRLFSSKWIFPESLRFALNAEALKRRDIPTVTVVERVRIPHLMRTGILYWPLAGRTLRQVATEGEVDAGLVFKLGHFVAQLHENGVYFRSLHLGNVVICPDGALGLIDIADMRVFPWPLWSNACIRNFRHLFRYQQDMRILCEAGIESLVEGYTRGERASAMSARLNSEIAAWPR